MHLSVLALLGLTGCLALDVPRFPLLARNSSSRVLPKNGSTALKPLYEAHSNSTPVFKNKKLLTYLSEKPDAKLHLDKIDPPADKVDPPSQLLDRRGSDELPVGTCAPGIPCSNGACCSNKGVCSYEPSSCGKDVCISNCDAKAPCGKYALPENAKCPLNVCCSQYGFCGSTDEFCGKGCQQGFGGCGPPPTPSCSGGGALQRRIGYYESWATTRPCDKVRPEDLQLTGMTHINFAFSFFDPSTFAITPMDANAGSLLSSFTALKTKQPGLQVWLSIGGWSFNDPTNTPDTQHAFSNMVSSAGNRRAFITSLLNFMQTYGFDGVDLDWEYPAADDRGGVKADFANFPIFLGELRSALGSLGISATLPSSYWYLQHFDLKAMEPHLDWFNLMSYDIHGVWDSTNKFTGPFIRPHTNLTEIEDGLSLLWRAGVKPGNVVLGLGWYGRSFTLADPSCNKPNGVCRFTEGASPGQCSKASGVLTNAEIKRIQATGRTVEGYDAKAGVKWMTWDSNQWVSYDDGVTMQQKMGLANGRCLGGIMIWALDQDDSAGSSMNDLLGVGTANGISPSAAQSYRDQMANATLQKAIGNSCYWSLCGKGCEPGYFGTTEARGQVAGIQKNSVCSGGQTQTLCCAPGTHMGSSCKWEGFRGIGMPCSPACSDPAATIVARNTNSYEKNVAGQTSDLTCTGGYQAYCCTGFKPSTITNAGSLILYGQNGDDTGQKSLAKRGELQERGAPLLLGGLGALCLEAAAPLAALIPFTFGLSAAVEGIICAAAGLAALAVGFAVITSVIGWIFGGKPSSPNKGTPTTGPGGRQSYGQWQILGFGTSSTKGCDCVVTYTCRYGNGFDEVCDNQRWAINKKLGGRTVFHPFSSGGGVNRAYSEWGQVRTQRHERYRTLVQGSRQPTAAQCQLDEFPMANLRESDGGAPQGCRLVNGKANGDQGRDYLAWKMAQWTPCFVYRRNVCKINDDGPPATWKFNALPPGRGSGSGKRFIDAYGFDAQTQNSLCFASFSYAAGGQMITTMVVNHGFRVLDDDPMYGNAYGWPRLYDWKVAPGGGNVPYNLQPGIFQRGLQEILQDDEASRNSSDSSPNEVCHVDLNKDKDDKAEFDYDSLNFVDMNGEPIDGRTCDIIYADTDEDQGPEVRVILDENDNVIDVQYVDEESSGAGQGAETVAATTGAQAMLATTVARPGSGSGTYSNGFVTSTMVKAGRTTSVVTPAALLL